MQFSLATILAISSILFPHGALAAAVMPAPGTSAAVVAPAVEAPAPDITLVSQLTVVTDTSSQCNTILAPATVFSIIFVGPQLATVIGRLAIQITTLGTLLVGPALVGNACTLALTALVKFVQVHQALLATIIGKAGLFSFVPGVGPAVAAALRVIEGVVDTIAGSILSLVPCGGPALKKQIASLQVSLKLAITDVGGN